MINKKAKFMDLRSETASTQNTWVCKITNQSQNNWNSISDSGYFNSLV